MATKRAIRGDKRTSAGRTITGTGSTGPPPLGAYDAVISAGARVPPRRQLAAQLAGAIRAGRYGPDQRLPGARDLARRLGIHRETVLGAYRELSKRGLVTLRPGSGAYVSGRLDPVGAAGGDAFRGFLARERAAGRTVAEVTSLVDRWVDSVKDRRVVVVGGDRELLAVWAAEAREELEPLGVEVRASSLAGVRREPRRLEAAAVVSAPEGLPEVRALAPRWAELVPVAAGIDASVRRLLLQLPRGAVVAVVSGSDRLRREAAELAAGLRGGEVAVAGLDPVREERLGRVLPVARFVLVDVPSRGAMRARVPGARLRTLRHLPRAGFRELAGYLTG